MKKKTIVFSCLAVLFLLSAFSGFSGGLVSGGVGCLVICGIFAFLAFRSAKSVTETNREVPQTPNRFTPSPNKNSFSQSLHDNTVNTDTAETPAAAPVPSAPAPQITEYIFAPIKVTGVTFNNDDGSSRQLILRKLHFHDSPFNEYADVEIKQYEYKGQPAYGVYVNNMQIGNIPADLIPFIQDNIERIESISYIDVYGGGQKDGKPISYGCKITLRFLKDNPPINVPDTLKIND